MKGLFKKLASNKTKTEPVVGCFGKLPLYPEFIRINAETVANRHFQQWVQNSFVQSNRDRSKESDRAPRLAHHFFLQETVKSSLILGYITDSCDQYGRCYPFIVFCQLTVDKQQKPMIPAAMYDFLAAAKSVCQIDWQQESMDSLQAEIKRLADTLPQQAYETTALDNLQKLNSYTFWQQLRLSPSNTSLGDLLYSVQQWLVKNVGTGKIQLPISDYRSEAQVSCWLRFIDQVLKQSDTNCQVFWNSTDMPGEMTIYPRSWQYNVFADLMAPQPAMDNVLANLTTMPEFLRDSMPMVEQASLIDVFCQWDRISKEPNYA